MWKKFLDFFGSLLSKVFPTSSKEVVDRIGDIVSDELAGLARSIAAAGIEDGAGLLLKLKTINRQTQETGGSGDDKKARYKEAAKVAWESFGGDVKSAALDTVLDVGAALFHQKDKADEIGAPRI